MTQYHTSCGTGTYSEYYNDCWNRGTTTATGTDYNNYRDSTTVTGTDYNNWSHLPVQTGTTNSSTLYNIMQTDTAYNIPVPDNLSEQELLRQREERSKIEETAKKALEEAAKADEKARLLLLEYLDDENRQRLFDKKPLEVPSRLFGDIKYHIPISNGRIKAWKENKVVTELCLAVKESGCLPTDDIVLTKLLHILHDEENMLRTANHFDKKENLLARLN